MSSFGWKRKATKLTAANIKAFTEDEPDDEEIEENAVFEWIHAAKRRRLILLEDCRTKSERLKQEGTILAENGRFKLYKSHNRRFTFSLLFNSHIKYPLIFYRLWL